MLQRSEPSVAPWHLFWPPQGLVCHGVSGQPVAMTHTWTPVGADAHREKTQEFNVQRPEIHLSYFGQGEEGVLVNIFLSQQPVLHRFFPESYRCSLFSGHPNLQNHHDVPLHLAEFPLWANSMSSSALFGICFLGFYVDLANVFRHWPFLCLLSQCCS